MINLGKIIISKRQELGLKQFELARRAEMSPAQLCQIENGRVSPSFHMVERIAAALSLDVVGLISGARPTADECAQMGSLPQETTNYIPIRAVEPDAGRALKAIAEAEERLDAYDDAHGVSSRCTIALNRVRQSISGIGAAAADELRLDLGLGTAPLGDLASLLEFRGVRIHRAKLTKDVTSVAFWNAARENLVVVLNDRATPERQLYRLVYELGSACLFVSRGNQRLDESLEQHRFLTDFTAAFLMPGVMVRTCVAATGIAPTAWTFDSLVAIKQHFGVSAEAFALRLEELGLIVPSLRVSLRDRLRAYYKSHPKAMEPKATSGGMRPRGVLEGIYE